MKGSIMDWTIEELKETVINDIFSISEQEQEPLTEKLIKDATEYVLTTENINEHALKHNLHISLRMAFRVREELFRKGVVTWKKWNENFVDESTNELTIVERSKLIFNHAAI